MELREALQLCIAKSSAIAGEGMKALMSISAHSPVGAQRAQHVIQYALSDPQASFSEGERLDLSKLLTGDSETKDDVIRLRVTASEKARIQDAAAAENLSVSDYIRRALGLN